MNSKVKQFLIKIEKEGKGKGKSVLNKYKSEISELRKHKISYKLISKYLLETYNVKISEPAIRVWWLKQTEAKAETKSKTKSKTESKTKSKFVVNDNSYNNESTAQTYKNIITS